MIDSTVHFVDRIMLLTLRLPLFIEKPCALKTQGSYLKIQMNGFNRCISNLPFAKFKSKAPTLWQRLAFSYFL